MIRFVTTFLALSALALAGCGGDDDPEAERATAQPEPRLQLNGADRPDVAEFPKPQGGQRLQAFADSIGATGTNIALATSLFTIGQNRVAFGLLGNRTRSSTHRRSSTSRAGRGQPRSAARTPPRPTAS